MTADQVRTHAAVPSVASPEGVSTVDERLSMGPRQAEDRRSALIAQQRWESDGGALRLW